MAAGNFLTDVMRSLSFLSRIPVHDIFFENDGRSMAETARAFPLAGIIIALPAAILIALLSSFDADPLLAAALALCVATVMTGALHEDGLADTADGFGGGKTRERALEIMKDSRIGAYGAIALILSFMVRAAALAALMRETSAFGIAAALIAAACVSRGALVWHWQALPPAKTEGVAVSVGQPQHRTRQVALVSGLAIATLIALLFFGVLHALVAVAMSLIVTHLFNRFCLRKIGGHTGDTIGATQQITEIVMLVALALIA